MNKKKTFIWIFAGVIAAGALVLGISFILRAAIKNNAIVTIITLFGIFGGAIMMALGLVAMLICLLLLVFSSGDKKSVVVEIDIEESDIEESEVKEDQIKNEASESTESLEQATSTVSIDETDYAESIEK